MQKTKKPIHQLAVVFFLTLFCATSLYWATHWGKLDDHKLGDPELARMMFYAGEWFISHGFQSYGLPVYAENGSPYTHLTPGPEWIQAIFALLRKLLASNVSVFKWHSLLTALLSLSTLLLLKKAWQNLSATQIELAHARKSSTLALLLLLPTTSVQLFAQHPYASGTLLINALSFFILSLWASSPKSEHQKWSLYLALFCIVVFGAFWMGLSPLPATCLWAFLAAYQFGAPRKQKARLLSLFVALCFIFLVCFGLKIFQNKLYLKNWHAVLEDATLILKVRQGVTSSHYSFSTHLAKIGWRLCYLFGITPLLCLVLALKQWSFVKSKKFLLGIALLCGFVWQIAMSQHSFYHIYLLREAMIPLGFFLTLFLGKMLQSKVIAEKKLFVIFLTISILQHFTLWTVLFKARLF